MNDSLSVELKENKLFMKYKWKMETQPTNSE